jgi:aminoglycoside 3-N-acetyltransferase I
MSAIATVEVRRLGRDDRELAARLFALMADVFEQDHTALSAPYLDRLLATSEFWALAALRDAELLGGLTAHTLPMTRAEACELFIYDVAVRADVQRQGVGRALVTAVRQQAAAEGIGVVFVPAENEDAHALDFYSALGGDAAAVTVFTFSGIES